MNAKSILTHFRLDGRVALVTGASRGIGKAIAFGLASAGADVALAGRNADTLGPIAAEIERYLGRRAQCVPFDVGDLDGLPATVEQVVGHFGKIDILVNNAGINVRRDSIDYAPDEWDAVLNANLKGAFFLTQEVGKHMLARRRGKILNISSMTAFLGVPALPAYSASKAGLQQLTKMLAVEWADSNIQVNAIAPGWISTELTAPLKDNPDFRPRYEWVLSRTPAGRFGEPDELAGTAVFLCSPAADFITGQVIAVDGGILAGSDWRKGR